MAQNRKSNRPRRGPQSSANGKSNGKPDGGSRRSRAEVAEQLASEKRGMARLGVPALAGGVLYLLSGIIISSTLSGAPTVGVLQGVKAGIAEGIAAPTVSPRAAEVKFVSHHAFPLIAGSGLMALALIVLTLALLLLIRASRFRREEMWPATAALVVIGGVGFAVASIGHQIGAAVLTHEFAVGHDFGAKAVEAALTKGPVNIASQYVSLLAGLSLLVGMIITSLNAMKVGLLTRWMGVVGMLSAVLIFLPIGGATLEVVPAFWLAALGLLYMGRWPGGELPAWSTGEARPWPTQAERMAEREGQRSGAGRQGSRKDENAAKKGSRNGAPKSPPVIAEAEADAGAVALQDAEPTAPAEEPDSSSGTPPPASRGGGATGSRRRRKRGSRG